MGFQRRGEESSDTQPTAGLMPKQMWPGFQDSTHLSRTKDKFLNPRHDVKSRSILLQMSWPLHRDANIVSGKTTREPFDALGPPKT